MVLLSAFFLTLLASLVSSTPTPSILERSVLPIRKSSAGVSTRALVDHGHARIAYFNGVPASDNTKRNGGGVVNNQDVSYVATVIVCGLPHKLVIDTGSSNLWIGAERSVHHCYGSISTGNAVSVQYGSGSFSGTEYVGSVSFAGLKVHKQSFGIAATSKGFTNVDGIIGLGPVDLTKNTVSNVGTVPTFADNLYSERKITSEVVGIYFAAEKGSDTDDANGELSFGKPDSHRYTGPISYFPKTHVSPFSDYWGLSDIWFMYGHENLINEESSAIVDTGTTLIIIPTPAYTKFAALSGGEKDAASGLLSFTHKPTKDFTFKISGKTFPLTPAQYLVPLEQYAHFDLETGKYYAWFDDGGSDGVNCLIGQKFLENYYSVYDTTKKRIGFASHKSKSW